MIEGCGPVLVGFALGMLFVVTMECLVSKYGRYSLPRWLRNRRRAGFGSRSQDPEMAELEGKK